jgi:hypothetical protein
VITVPAWFGTACIFAVPILALAAAALWLYSCAGRLPYAEEHETKPLTEVPARW